MIEWYLFALGLAAGIAILTISAYLSVSPSWLRWLLILMGAVLVGRYVLVAQALMQTGLPTAPSLLPAWSATLFTLTFPALVGFDQLVRDPRMTPNRLLRLYLPMLLGYLAVLAAAQWPATAGFWPLLFAGLQVLFTAGLFAAVRQAWKFVTAPPARVALSALVGGCSLLAIDSVWSVLSRAQRSPSLLPELLAGLAIWLALHTSQRTSS